MAKMNRNKRTIVLRTSGMPLYFFGMLIVLVGWVLLGGVVASIISFLEKDNATFLHISVKYNDLIKIPLGVPISIWMIYYSAFYLMANKIVLTNDELIIDEYLMPVSNSAPSWKNNLIPKKIKIQIKLQNIKSITLGTGRNLEKLSKEESDAFLEEEINKIKQEKLPLIGAEGLTWFARQFSPSILITEKNEGKHFVSVKPFSKTGILKLLNKLGERDIPVRIDLRHHRH